VGALQIYIVWYDRLNLFRSIPLPRGLTLSRVRVIRHVQSPLGVMADHYSIHLLSLVGIV